MKKILGIILIGLLLVGVGFAVAKLIGIGGIGQIEKSMTLTVIVTATGDYEIDISPKNAAGEAELIIPKGGTGSFLITNVPSGGFDANISSTFTGLPEGSFSFSVNPVAAGQTTVLTIDATNLTSNSNYGCSLRATDI